MISSSFVINIRFKYFSQTPLCFSKILFNIRQIVRSNAFVQNLLLTLVNIICLY